MLHISATSLWLVLLLSWSFVVIAEVAVPPLTGHVIDQTSTLTTEQQSGLERTLRSFEAQKGSQVAVLIIPSTQPETIEQYAMRVAEQWKLGRKNIDDGVILLIAKADRTLRIEVGYGLEGVLTDATSKRIIAETITPYFKQGDFHSGITAGVQQIIQVVNGEPLPAPSAKTQGENPGGNKGIQQYFPLIFILALVIGGLLRTLLGRFLGAVVTGGAVAFLTWIFAGVLLTAVLAGVFALIFTLLGGGSGGRPGGFGGFGGGGFGGGLGGGGFSGGGGGFGGGGASGRW